MDIPIRFGKSSHSRHVEFGSSDDDFNEHDRFDHSAWTRDEEFEEEEPDEKKSELLWAVLASYLPTDEKSIQRLFVQHAEYSLSQTKSSLTKNKHSSFQALALSLRDRVIERWKDTDLFFQQQGVKRVNYLSLEFLLGRSLQNAMGNLGLTDVFKRSLYELGVKMEELYDEEHDAGLGNGGLGRLAACFLDSMATMNYPGWGYGLRYNYGMFEQKIKNGYQVELPDYWLIAGNPWEIERNDVMYTVRMYGQVSETSVPVTHRAATPLDALDELDNKKYHWEGGELVVAVAYDVPVPGFNTFNTINLRLWSSRPSNEFDLNHFNQGDYFKAIEGKQRSETICSVLYPNDNTYTGKELRLKQQYFFVSATIQDIIHRFKQMKKPLDEFPNYNSIQLNDTHPTLGIAELMRILIDEEGLKWKQAWDITQRTFSYTNHTVMPEALEKWTVSLMERLLPRHMKLIYDINHYWLKVVEQRWPNDMQKLKALSIIEEEPEKKVRMAHLAIVVSHTVNGVAALHTELLITQVFPEFNQIFPNKFVNVTNGVTPRRWMAQANPGLSTLITKYLKTDQWKTSLSLLAGLRQFADDATLHKEWSKIKRKNKKRVVKYIREKLGVRVTEDALFDVQIKRFHEYKRQMLLIMGTLYRYRQIKGMSDEEKADVVPRVVIFGGKAAPGYYMAKLIIKLINTAADVINNDPDVGDLLKLVFIPNYCVSLAEILIPATDLSEQISTAGHEASGTSNMKFAMNGALTIGTMDGANIEIREEVGDENIFIFGALTPDVPKLRKAVYEQTAEIDPRFDLVIEMLRSGQLGNFDELVHIVNSITDGHDYYLVGPDFESYLEAQRQVDEAYKNPKKWWRMSILNSAGMGKFSSDRSIKDYAEKVWKLKSLARPGPVTVQVDKLSTAGLLPHFTHLNAVSASPSDVALERLSPLHSETIRSFSPQI